MKKKTKKKISKVEREILDNFLVGVTSAVLLCALFMAVMYNLFSNYTTFKGTQIALIVITVLEFVGAVTLLVLSKTKQNKKFTTYSVGLFIGTFLCLIPLLFRSKANQGVILTFLALAVILVLTFYYYALKFYLLWEKKGAKNTFYIISAVLILASLGYMVFKYLKVFGYLG